MRIKKNEDGFRVRFSQDKDEKKMYIIKDKNNKIFF